MRLKTTIRRFKKNQELLSYGGIKTTPSADCTQLSSDQMISNLWEPIQNYICKIDTGNMPAVHHYTTLKGALGILESKHMWFTERAHLNDPSEISHGVEIAEKLLRKKDDELANRLNTNVESVFRNFRFFSTSFSFEDNDLSQWRNYADDGKGVVLSFRASAFNQPKAHADRFINDNPTAFVCPISYDDACLKSVIENILEKWSGENVAELCDHLFMISSMFKHHAWVSEKEYRFFIHHGRDKILNQDCYKIRELNGRIISYLDLPIQNIHSQDDFPIYRIVVGPAAAPNVEILLRDFIMSMEIPIRQEAISKSEIPYRSVR